MWSSVRNAEGTSLVRVVYSGTAADDFSFSVFASARLMHRIGLTDFVLPQRRSNVHSIGNKRNSACL